MKDWKATDHISLRERGAGYTPRWIVRNLTCRKIDTSPRGSGEQAYGFVRIALAAHRSCKCGYCAKQNHRCDDA